jgi:hypothetical protein
MNISPCRINNQLETVEQFNQAIGTIKIKTWR